MGATPNLSRKTLIIANVQSDTTAFTSTWFTPASASNRTLLLWDEVNPISMDVKVLDQQVIRASLSQNQQLVGRRLWMLKPKTMVMCSPGADYTNSTGASPIAGVPPFFGPLLRGCGLQETVSLSASVVYTPRSSGFESVAFYVWTDAILHKMFKAFGNCVFEGRAGEGIDMSYDFKGTFNLPDNSISLPAPTYPADSKLLVQSEALTIDAYNTGGSNAPIVRSFRFDLGINVIERGDLNSAFGLYGLYITDKKPTLEIVMEVENALSGNGSIDPFGDIADATGAVTTYSIAMLHGSSSPNKFKFNWPYAQLKDVQYQDDQGIRTYQLSFNLTSVPDDGEYSLKCSGNVT